MEIDWKLREKGTRFCLDATGWRSLSKRFGEKTELLLTCTWLAVCVMEEGSDEEDDSDETVGFKRKCNFLRIGGFSTAS